MSTPPYRIILEPDGATGYWTAEVPAFGFVTEGRDANGARHAAYAAIEGYIEGAKRKGLPVPAPDLQVTCTTVIPSRPAAALTENPKKAAGHKNAAGHKKAVARKKTVNGGGAGKKSLAEAGRKKQRR